MILVLPEQSLEPVGSKMLALKAVRTQASKRTSERVSMHASHGRATIFELVHTDTQVALLASHLKLILLTIKQSLFLDVLCCLLIRFCLFLMLNECMSKVRVLFSLARIGNLIPCAWFSILQTLVSRLLLTSTRIRVINLATTQTSSKCSLDAEICLFDSVCVLDVIGFSLFCSFSFIFGDNIFLLYYNIFLCVCKFWKLFLPFCNYFHLCVCIY